MKDGLVKLAKNAGIALAIVAAEVGSAYLIGRALDTEEFDKSIERYVAPVAPVTQEERSQADIEYATRDIKYAQ